MTGRQYVVYNHIAGGRGKMRGIVVYADNIDEAKVKAHKLIPMTWESLHMFFIYTKDDANPMKSRIFKTVKHCNSNTNHRVTLLNKTIIDDAEGADGTDYILFYD
jgi:hypothetical protein